MRTLPILLFLAVTAISCVRFEPETPGPQLEGIPSRYSLYGDVIESSLNWWEDFGSEQLNQLVCEALAGNFTVREARARLAQAHLAAGKTAAETLPELSSSVATTQSGEKEEDQETKNTLELGLGFMANYEIDLWGRKRAEEEAANLFAEASGEDLRIAMLSVTGEIAETWFGLQANVSQADLLVNHRDLQLKLLDLIKYRFARAKSTALDIYQQQQTIFQIEEALIPLATEQAQLRRRLALLLGKASLADNFVPTGMLPEVGPLPALGLPADLLAARPDVRAAGLRLRAAEWEIAAARADRLPSLNLSASNIYSAEKLSALFTGWLTKLAGTLSGPIFDSGRRRLEVEKTKALAWEHLAFYGRIVFSALKEVEDALTEEQGYGQMLQSLSARRELSEKTLREARRRYFNGSADFLNVLREELNTFQVQRDIIITRQKQLVSRVHLYKALGRGWVSATAPRDTEQTGNEAPGNDKG